MQTIVSVDGFIATQDDQVGPLFDWFGTGDTPLYENGPLVTAQSHAYYRPMLDAIGALVVGRHVFDMTDGWGGESPAETTAWSSRIGQRPQAGTPPRRSTSSTT